MASKNRIFIAHAREDKPQVRDLYDRLRGCGFDPWLDEVDLLPGQRWKEEIPKAIAGASVFIACLSRQSVQKRSYVQREFRTALSAYAELPAESIFLIPVRLDDCEMPDVRIPDLDLGLSDLQWVDLFEEKGFDRLVLAIQRALNGNSAAEPRISTSRASSSSDDHLDRIEARAVSDAPKTTEAEMPLSGDPRVEARSEGSFSWRHPTIVAAIIGAIAVVAAAFFSSPILDRYFDNGDHQADPVADNVAPEELAAGQETSSSVSSKSPKSHAPGETFRDCEHCPEMIVIPAGSFLMSSPADELQRHAESEDPQHLVTISQNFGIGKYEVTFAEWDACVEGGGCNGYVPNDHGWGRGNRPVIFVSWNDARRYVAWLSELTGEKYRLPSEAEWEYAARAGSTTRFWWGDGAGSNNANCRGCNSKWDFKKTAPVGSFASNKFGLFDTVGNLFELLEDQWHENYIGAPSDGTAWVQGDDFRRAVHGGSWASPPDQARAAARFPEYPDVRDSDLGFRVARDLDRNG